VILLDIGLPRMNGFEVCRRIREQSWGRRIVISAITGWGQDLDRRRSQEAGFDHHLIKPVEHGTLLKVLAPEPV
jgi:CheY-like chemotaxis protein